MFFTKVTQKIKQIFYVPYTLCVSLIVSEKIKQQGLYAYIPKLLHSTLNNGLKHKKMITEVYDTQE
jgi:hypothetical protein